VARSATSIRSDHAMRPCARITSLRGVRGRKACATFLPETEINKITKNTENTKTLKAIIILRILRVDFCDSEAISQQGDIDASHIVSQTYYAAATSYSSPARTGRHTT
jgi:hypothetical protein